MATSNTPTSNRHNAARLDAVLSELKLVLGDRLSTSTAVRDQHAQGEDHFRPAPPDAVAFAETTEEVSAILKVCNAHEFPVIAWGTGTSLEGNVQAIHGGEIGRAHV